MSGRTQSEFEGDCEYARNCHEALMVVFHKSEARRDIVTACAM